MKRTIEQTALSGLFFLLPYHPETFPGDAVFFMSGLGWYAAIRTMETIVHDF